MLKSIEERHSMLTLPDVSQDFVERYLYDIESYILDDCFDKIDEIYVETGEMYGENFNQVIEDMEKAIKYYDDALITGLYNDCLRRLQFKINTNNIIEQFKANNK